MIGFLNINKPPDCTSHDVVAILRKSLGIKKIGHCGTLDPFATGVLIIAINDATRLIEYLPSDKTYLAKIKFGIETDTDDITGKITLQTNKIPIFSEIIEGLKLFAGKIKQKPPIFSAIKLNGKRAYKLAREHNISLDDISERIVEIYSIIPIAYNEDILELKIHSSSGTYIRSIARDLGKALNTSATLLELRRIKVGDYFKIEESINSELINKQTLSKYLISPLDVLNLPKISLNSMQILDIINGKRIVTEKQKTFVETHGPASLLMDNNEKLIGVGLQEKDNIIKPKKIFINE